MSKHFYSEIPIITASGAHRAFLPASLYNLESSFSHVREHNYTEIHLFAGGNAYFTVEGERISVNSGEMLVIPRKTYHRWEKEDKSTLHCAFQVDCDVPSLEKYELGEKLIMRFFDAVREADVGDDHSVAAVYIALFCTYFEEGNKLLAQPVTDPALLICEFFEKNYDSDVRLSDLADMLHLSERQTERLVIEHTGRSSRDELAAARVRVARHLLGTTELPLTEIARRVGYSSYSGFWKVMKKF